MLLLIVKQGDVHTVLALKKIEDELGSARKVVEL